MRDEKAFQWLNESELSYDIWSKKYRVNNESFDEWLDRVSGKDPSVKKLIEEKKFLFGGRILAQRGVMTAKTSLSNCYVLPAPTDNIESIWDCAKQMARTYSYGGGCGTDLGKLAPRGASVNNAAKTTSGAVSFMDLFSITTGLIGQQGRRGALMLTMPITHPDIEEFVDIKKDLDRITKANISIRFNDNFFEAVKQNKDFTTSFTREATGEKIEKKINAKKFFEHFAHNAWDMAEPGALFWDRIQNYNLCSDIPEYRLESTNPCAEEPLPPGGACLLGSLNLSEFVGSDKFIKIDELKEAICIAVRGLNTVLDEGIERHPLPLQRQMARDWRQIGLGIFGLADMLIKMEVRYDSDEAIELCSCLAHIIAETAIMESNRLAIEYGAFPKCDNEAICNSEFIQNLELNPAKRESILTYGLRNSAILTIAPTGSLSTMFGVSGGIEPIFSNSYTRKTESLNGQDTYYKVYTPVVEQYMREHGVKEEAELPPYFVTAHDIDPLLRVKMQATWQECVDASISSTVNLKHDATPSDVFNVYLKAWELGCKGVTVYRDGCARTGILTTDSKNPEESPRSVKKLQRGDIIKCSDDMIGKKRKLMTGCGSLHCEAFFDPETGDLMETFFSKGSTGGCNSFMVGLSRMISLAARSGCDFDSIIDQLNSCITCPSYAVRKAVNKDTSPGNCCPAAIGKALKEMHDEMLSEIGEVVTELKVTTKPEAKDKPIVQSKDKCPECGEPLEHAGGCATCPNCGWSRCG